jgi:hypothetical protein
VSALAEMTATPPFLPELAERFLRAVLERVPLERVAELHLFEPMRQGGVETGIAVLAVEAEGTAPGDDPAAHRHTVFTARYRTTLKGPERGKWECDVTAEALAPLVTVETVVRGVQRRAGDEVPPVRYDAGQLARALRLPVPERVVRAALLAAEAAALVEFAEPDAPGGMLDGPAAAGVADDGPAATAALPAEVDLGAPPVVPLADAPPEEPETPWPPAP